MNPCAAIGDGGYWLGGGQDSAEIISPSNNPVPNGGLPQRLPDVCYCTPFPPGRGVYATKNVWLLFL